MVAGRIDTDAIAFLRRNEAKPCPLPPVENREPRRLIAWFSLTSVTQLWSREQAEG